jgi:DMSO/TMAO reductase YedYZ molybdopterin-dependent catalytic subunit
VLDPAAWRLRVRAGEATREWTYAELAGFTDRVEAVLDCTGGWYARVAWEGARLDRLLPPGALERAGSTASVVVASATGYRRRLPLADAGTLLLATRLDGRPLAAGHGFPARLVAPGRRGFWWVKWVVSVDLDPSPWWRQPPFPLT